MSRTAAIVVLAAAAGIAGAPQVAGADPTETRMGEEDEWHLEALMGASVPLALDAYRDSVGFGGRVAARLHRRALALQLEVAAFETETPQALENVTLRTRALAGVRWATVDSVTGQGTRAFALRALAGVELGRFVDSGGARLGPGAAAELAAETISALDWGTVTLSLGLGISVQPTGDPDAEEARYVGLELLAGAAIGF